MLLVDLQHNRAMVNHWQYIWFCFSRRCPPFLILGLRTTSLHCCRDLIFPNSRLLSVWTLHHILRYLFCSFPSISSLIYYYIVISLNNDIFIELAHHHCFSFLSHISFADFDLTLSLRCRSLVLLQITISALQRTNPLAPFRSSLAFGLGATRT